MSKVWTRSAAPAEPAILPLVQFAASQLVPKAAIGLAALLDRIDEEAVMLAFDLGQAVADSREEVVVCIENMAGEVELDHGLRLSDGGDLAFEIGHRLAPRGDVAGEFDDLHRLAAAVEDWRVVRQQPDPAPPP